MIKIDNEYLDDVAKNFFNGIQPEIEKRLRFFKKAFQLIQGTGGVILQDLTRFPTLHVKTVTSYLKQFLITPGDMTAMRHHSLIQTLANVRPYLNNHASRFEGLIDRLLIKANLEKLLLALPQKMLAEQTALQFLGWNNDEVKPIINSIIDYGEFDSDDKFAYDAYALADDLQVNVCPYCNRSFTATIITVNGRKITRPTLDHFFDKGRNPLLALSFYNLVPSCSLCNSYLKGKKEFKLHTHLHPYLYGFDQHATFFYKQKALHPDKTHPSNFEVTLTVNIPNSDPQYRKIAVNPLQEEEGNMQIFKLEEIYQSHADVVGEIVLKADQNSPYYADTIKDLIKGVNASEEDFYRYYFGNYLNSKDFNKRPLAKLTKDIVVRFIPELGK